MEFLLKTAYYGVSGISLVLFGLFFVGNLFQPGDGVEKAILLVAGLTGCGFLGWSFAAGHLGGHWAMGIGLVLVGLLLFGVMNLVGLLMFTKVRWN